MGIFDKKNWKTTIGGLAVGAPVVLNSVVNAYASGQFSGKSFGQILFGVAIMAWGSVMKDHDTTGVGDTAYKETKMESIPIPPLPNSQN